LARLQAESRELGRMQAESRELGWVQVESRELGRVQVESRELGKVQVESRELAGWVKQVGNMWRDWEQEMELFCSLQARVWKQEPDHRKQEQGLLRRV